ncbi:hypothetical protein FRACYDRAFT_233552 [Fragilariopsis cylindrus CCMP1102]|uniref:BTB domain-containing protein n=1 Tax=Fragilariopsis cylindrus CCMP1102 TaxID=635003 RepID=A0A1E7FZ03_9STRA|nr:hypothetical protein FRACYDRAFT_233552 [Fragilariopsis cylindrus CCMP1102]|eukprot:OEU23380.1 hypothetical protein FRACYDRAFT_233552 [Fragilariopsis cylindrus CCMP1102]
MTEDSKNRKLEGDNEEERKRSSLRCAVANLKVIVGGEQGDGGGNNTTNDDETPTTKKVFWHYTTVLASQSRYVDALLASKKNDSYGESTAANFTEITFPDISPSQWKRMIKFLTNVKAAWDMSKKDAIELIILYDKYDFTQGIELCDRVLSSIFYKDSEEFKKHRNDLDLLDRCIDVVVLSHEKNLKETMKYVNDWLYNILFDGYDSELLFLTIDHMNEVGDWTISEDVSDGDGVPLFICKGNRCAILPPKKGWERTDGIIGDPWHHKSSSVRTEIDN